MLVSIEPSAGEFWLTVDIRFASTHSDQAASLCDRHPAVGSGEQHASSSEDSRRTGRGSAAHHRDRRVVAAVHLPPRRPPAPAATAASAFSRGRCEVRRTGVRTAGRVVRRDPLGRPPGRVEHVGWLRPDAPHRRRPQRGRGPVRQAARSPRPHSLRTLYKASELTGLDPVALRNDAAANIDGWCCAAGVVPAVARPARRRRHLSGPVVRRCGVVRRGRRTGWPRAASPTTSTRSWPAVRPVRRTPGSRS